MASVYMTSGGSETHFGANVTSVKLTELKFQAAVNPCNVIKLRRIFTVANLCACAVLPLFKKQPVAKHLGCIN